MRFTHTENEEFQIKPEQLKTAIQKLGLFEDLIEKITSESESLSKELEVLRTNHQEKSYKFRELMGRKLVNSRLIDILKENNIL